MKKLEFKKPILSVLKLSDDIVLSSGDDPCSEEEECTFDCYYEGYCDNNSN